MSVTGNINQPPAGTAQRNGAALFRRSDFTRHKSVTTRVGLVVLWLVLVAGTLIWSGGGWQAWRNLNPNLLMAVFGLALQLVVSWSQLVSSDRPLSLQYLVSVAISISSSLAGHLPLISYWLGYTFEIMPMTAPWLVSMIAAVVVALCADVLPERGLFE